MQQQRMPLFEAMAPSSPDTRLVFLPLALAAAETLAAYRFNAWAAPVSLRLFLVSLALLFGASSLLVALRLPAMPPWGLTLLMLGGLAAGVVIDLIVSGEDRTLFPLEIAILWLVLVAPILSGAWLGRLLHRRRRRRAQT